MYNYGMVHFKIRNTISQIKQNRTCGPLNQIKSHKQFSDSILSEKENNYDALRFNFRQAFLFKYFTKCKMIYYENYYYYLIFTNF